MSNKIREALELMLRAFDPQAIGVRQVSALRAIEQQQQAITQARTALAELDDDTGPGQDSK